MIITNSSLSLLAYLPTEVNSLTKSLKQNFPFKVFIFTLGTINIVSPANYFSDV